MGAAAAARWCRLFPESPARLRKALATTCLTSAAAHAVGDLACQAIVDGAAETGDVDGPRLARMTAVGGTLHGPFFFVGFRAVDMAVPSSSAATRLGVAARKVCLGHCTLFPAYLASFFVYISALEGRDWDGIAAKVRDAYPKGIWNGSAYWPAVQLYNQLVVPPRHKVGYTSVMAIFWNVYISYANKQAALRLDAPSPERDDGANDSRQPVKDL